MFIVKNKTLQLLDSDDFSFLKISTLTTFGIFSLKCKTHHSYSHTFNRFTMYR